MNKTELRKIAKALINERFEMFSNIRLVELDCERSTIDKMLYVNYLVIVNNVQIYKVHVSEDEYQGTTDIFYKEGFTRVDESSTFTGLYNPTTCKQEY